MWFLLPRLLKVFGWWTRYVLMSANQFKRWWYFVGQVWWCPNADLAHGLGNLVARVSKSCRRGWHIKPKSSRPSCIIDCHMLLMGIGGYMGFNQKVDATRCMSRGDKDDPEKRLSIGRQFGMWFQLPIISSHFIPETSEKILAQFWRTSIATAQPVLYETF